MGALAGGLVGSSLEAQEKKYQKQQMGSATSREAKYCPVGGEIYTDPQRKFCPVHGVELRVQQK